MAVRLEYDLTGTGWSECTLEIDGNVATVTASYLSDALGDLASAVTALMRGHSKAVARFWEEPGEYRWIFESIGADRVHVCILEFAGMLGDSPEDRGSVVFDGTCARFELGRAMLRCLERVQQQYGVEGYRTKWVQHEFPSGSIPQLTELVGGA